MDGLRTQFGGGIAAMAVVMLATAIGLVVVWRRAPLSDRETGRRQAGWVTLAGSVALVVSATGLPHAWPPVWDGWGDLALRPGDGGLASWRDLVTPFNSLPTVQLWANVAIYVPVGMALRIVTGSAARTLLIGAALSIVVEAWQLVALSRVASTDDVLLNVVGVTIGLTVAAVASRGGRKVGGQPLKYASTCVELANEFASELERRTMKAIADDQREVELITADVWGALDSTFRGLALATRGRLDCDPAAFADQAMNRMSPEFRATAPRWLSSEDVNNTRDDYAFFVRDNVQEAIAPMDP